MMNPPKHWKAEYAKSARLSCKSCKNTIDKGNLKLDLVNSATLLRKAAGVYHHLAHEVLPCLQSELVAVRFRFCDLFLKIDIQQLRSEFLVRLGMVS
ncbi:Poly [ADP-ribose] polymerase 1 [Camellia lanceoleosa]|uniref:Poly [ADP-ribose] polymerase 1 n=1 Tax=Camellia lanceoleosa TaxID=1840588 RepID=A0ACC0IU33_9ERIC|nr:Poly [ADP-ribose] polymerase 1 [Camellia lanceoleosa]